MRKYKSFVLGRAATSYIVNLVVYIAYTYIKKRGEFEGEIRTKHEFLEQFVNSS